MVVVHLDRLAIDVDGQRFGASGVVVSTFDIVDDDLEVLVVDQVVGTLTHEVEARAVKRLVVRVAGGRTGGLAFLCGARPFASSARAVRKTQFMLMKRKRRKTN